MGHFCTCPWDLLFTLHWTFYLVLIMHTIFSKLDIYMRIKWVIFIPAHGTYYLHDIGHFIYIGWGRCFLLSVALLTIKWVTFITAPRTYQHPSFFCRCPFEGSSNVQLMGHSLTGILIPSHRTFLVVTSSWLLRTVIPIYSIIFKLIGAFFVGYNGFIYK